jgi:hypothetical protein
LAGTTEEFVVSTLQNISGTIALAGAGKMGGAMLTGWLAGGLDPKRVVVIEPMPSADISALAAGGIRLNPKDAGAVDTLVIAVKPQSFREAGPALKALVAPSTLVVSIMAGTTMAVLQEVWVAQRCAPCRTRRPRSAAASRSRCPRRMSAPHSAPPRMRCCVPSARSSGSMTKR